MYAHSYYTHKHMHACAYTHYNSISFFYLFCISIFYVKYIFKMTNCTHKYLTICVYIKLILHMVLYKINYTIIEYICPLKIITNSFIVHCTGKYNHISVIILKKTSFTSVKNIIYTLHLF